MRGKLQEDESNLNLRLRICQPGGAQLPVPLATKQEICRGWQAKSPCLELKKLFCVSIKVRLAAKHAKHLLWTVLDSALHL